MNEIKPEHVSDEFLIDPNQPCEHRESIACVLNVAQQHGFTVLKPGELYWVEVNIEGYPKYKERHALSMNHYFIIEESIINQGAFNVCFLIHKNGHRQSEYNIPTLEAAQQFCQQLENEARST